MYSYIKGELVKRTDDYIVVDNNGIGYEITCPIAISSKFGGLGETVTCWVYQSVREDDISLFGFSAPEEKDMFLLLITVNGVGPKGGLSILSVATASDIKYAILSGDVKLISSASGIGKKTAERIVLDLKDKFKYTENMIDKEIRINNSNLGVNTVLSSDKNEAVMGLMALGYSSTEAQHAVNQVENTKDMDVEAILKESLKFLL